MFNRLLFFSILVGALSLNAFQSNFSQFEKIEYPETPALAEYISPFVADWDGDGITDVIVGDLSRENMNDKGRILFYKNIGTNLTPKLGKPIILKDDSGKDIKTSAS